jgi:transcription-repair coupling factor (superfamily II helicase)
MVEDCGDMAVRGGIIDAFSPNSLEPIRIEFNGDSIDSIRVIDINTQRSIRTIAKTVIVSPLVDSTGGSFMDVSDGSSPLKADLSLTETITAYLRPSAPILLYHPAQAHNALAEYWKHLHQVEEPLEQTELAVERLFNTIRELCNSRHSAVITVDFRSGYGSFFHFCRSCF